MHRLELSPWQRLTVELAVHTVNTITTEQSPNLGGGHYSQEGMDIPSPNLAGWKFPSDFKITFLKQLVFI